MVAGLKFLSKKGFNPQNLSNQKRVWEREQRAATEARRLKERADQLRRERDDEELARARGDQVKLGFMYQAPPGLESSNNKGNKDEKSAKQEESSVPNAAKSSSAAASSHDVTARQPGDDDAAAAFRAMLAGGASSVSPSQQEEGTDDQTRGGARGIIRGTAPGAFGTVLQGSSYDKMAATRDEKQSFDPSNLSNLEKAVGRRQQGSALTLEEQIERFPALANAPRQRGVQVGVSFKPLGTQIRNVRCMKCGVWGHSKGDRECQMSGWDPFSASATSMPTAAATSRITREEDESKPPAATAYDPDGERRARRKRSSREYSSDDDDSRSDSEDSYRRRKRRRKHARRSYDDGNSDDESSHRRRKKRHSKKKKKKKKHRKRDREESSSRRRPRLDSSDESR